MTHKPLGVAPGTFPSNSQPSNMTLPNAFGCQQTRAGHEEMLPPCGRFAEQQLYNRCFRAPNTHRACGAFNNTCLQNWPGLGNRKNIRKTQTFKKPNFRRESLLTLFKKKNPDHDRKQKVADYPRNAYQNSKVASSRSRRYGQHQKVYKQSMGNECGEKGTFQLGEWKCTLVTATRKHCIPVPRKLRRERPYTTACPLLGATPENP